MSTEGLAGHAPANLAGYGALGGDTKTRNDVPVGAGLTVRF